MARISGNKAIAALFSGMSVYSMKGSDKLIVRKKGGPTKKRLKEDGSYERTRLHNAEFRTCVRCMTHVFDNLYAVRSIADHNFAPKLTSMMRKLQVLNDTHNLGERTVSFSRHGKMLTGFQLSRNHQFDQVIRYPIPFVIDRDTASATIMLPALIPAINLVSPWKSPLYRFAISLSLLTDSDHHTHDLKECVEYKLTSWHPFAEKAPEQNVHLQMAGIGPLATFQTLLLTIGIETGTLSAGMEINQVPHQGCAKILAIG